jgi:hypothetical protein
VSRGRPTAFPLLMQRLGLNPQNTEFNRRAAAYAAYAVRLASAADYQRRCRAKAKAISAPSDHQLRGAKSLGSG